MTPCTTNVVRRSKRLLLFCAIPLALVAAACNANSKTPSAEAPAPTTATPTVVADPTVTAAGSLLRPPTTALTIPAESDCHQLLTIPLASIGSCATATSPAGSITGTDEAVAHSQHWDVWKRDGNDADLVLTYSGNFQSTPGFVFHNVDVAHDGETKLVAIEHIPGVNLVTAVDIIETCGAVVAHIPVGADGGVVGPATGGGIETWTPAGTSSDTASIIRYTNGEWRTIPAGPVSTNQVPTYPNDDGFGGGLP